SHRATVSVRAPNMRAKALGDRSSSSSAMLNSSAVILRYENLALTRFPGGCGARIVESCAMSAAFCSNARRIFRDKRGGLLDREPAGSCPNGVDALDNAASDFLVRLYV